MGQLPSDSRCAHPDQPAKSLEQHAWDLGVLVREGAVGSAALGGRAEDVADWLTLAGGLQRVEIDTGRYDQTAYLCGRVLEYEGARSDAIGQVQTELTRLLYGWGAYETLRRAAAATLSPRSNTETSDRDARAWLAAHWTDEPPPHYRCAIRGLQRLATAHPHLASLATQLAPGPGYPEVVLGLRVAGQLRHRLAHGDLVHPTPTEWGGSPEHDAMLARGACRLLLMSLQMLLAAVTYHEGLVIERLDEDDDVRHVDLGDALLAAGVQIHADIG